MIIKKAGNLRKLIIRAVRSWTCGRYAVAAAMAGRSARSALTVDRTAGRSGPAARRALVALAALCLALSLLAVVSAGTASAQTSYTVQVGYYDALRPNPSQLPAPWPGAGVTAVANLTNVYTEGSLIFYGCDPSICNNPSSPSPFDGGAVRIVNTSAAPLTLTSVTITAAPGCTYNIWPEIGNKNFPAIPFGGSLILTETVGGGGNGCTPGNGRMDSSDIGPLINNNNFQYAGSCASADGIIPEVSVTDMSGTTTTFQDTGYVLNTGGVDFASCSGPGTYNYNEGLSWVDINSPVTCGTDKVTIAPSSQTLNLSGKARVTADVTNACGQPISGVPVQFSFINSADQLSPETITTGTSGTSAGVATLSYSYQGANPNGGSDTIQASVATAGGTFYSNQAMVTWKPSSTAVAGVVVSGSPLPAQPAGVQYTATVTGNSATPLGSIAVSDNAGHRCTISMLNRGSGSCLLTQSASTVPANGYVVTARYSPATGSVYTNWCKPIPSPCTARVTLFGKAASKGSATTGANSGVSVIGAGASGTLTEGQYGKDPIQKGLTDGNDYFDISVSANSTFTQAFITDCSTGITSASALAWYDKATGTWEPVQGRPGPTYSQGPPACLTVTLNNSTTNPSSPTISQLNGTVFGAQTGDGFTSPASTIVRSGQRVNFTVTTTGTSTPALVETAPLPPGLSFKDNGNGTGTLSGTAPQVSSNTTYHLVFTAVWPDGSALQDFPLTDTTG